MIQKNQFFRQTNQPKPRSLAASQVVCKNGYRVEIPASCFYKTSGLPKKSVLKYLIGAWNKEHVDYLVKHFSVRILSESEEKGA